MHRSISGIESLLINILPCVCRGKNFRHAAARYQKALSHCAKFFDLSGDDEAEVKALKLSLYLNLATCYIKLEVL